MNLIGIAKGLSANTKGKSLKEIYKSYMINHHIRSFFTKIPPIDFVKIIFLTKAINDGKDPKKELETINSFLFSFSAVFFDPEDPEIECSDCDGNGRRECYNCGGDGNITCDYCDGSGKDSDDEEGDSDCDHCDGEGTVTCDYCDGNGEYDCDYCGGIGYETLENLKKYTMQQYVSYNTSVFDYVHKFENSMEAIDENYLLDAPNTFVIDTNIFEPETRSDDYEYNIKDKFVDNTYINRVIDTPDLDLSYTSVSMIDNDSSLRKIFKKKS
jgi:hypothetical protein